MNTRCALRELTRRLLLAALLVGLAACAPKPAAAPQAWIDAPADGDTVPAGVAVTVACHASAPAGLSELVLSLNGTPFRSVPVADEATAYALTAEWIAEGSGPTTLQVTAFDSTGAKSTPATVIVKVEGAAAARAMGTPALTVTATATTEAGQTPTASATATAEPTATATAVPTAVPTATPIPPAEVSFSVEQETLELGQCTTLHWSVEHVTAVYLDGEGVAGNDSRQVCPTENTKYTLHVEAPSGNVDRTVMVSVQDTTPPPLPTLIEPAGGVTLYTLLPCKRDVTLRWSPVMDPSFVTYEVQWWAPGQEPTSFTTGSINGNITLTLDCDEYRWRVQARDGAGNKSAWTNAAGFSVKLRILVHP